MLHKVPTAYLLLEDLLLGTIIIKCMCALFENDLRLWNTIRSWPRLLIFPHNKNLFFNFYFSHSGAFKFFHFHSLVNKIQIDGCAHAWRFGRRENEMKIDLTASR